MLPKCGKEGERGKKNRRVFSPCVEFTEQSLSLILFLFPISQAFPLQFSLAWKHNMIERGAKFNEEKKLNERTKEGRRAYVCDDVACSLVHRKQYLSKALTSKKQNGAAI